MPTEHLPHRIVGLLSIDHIAVDSGVPVTYAKRLDANGLSDHDGYIVGTSPPARYPSIWGLPPVSLTRSGRGGQAA